MSQCGTFALVGSAGGSIDLFNMQSGSHRQKFPSRSLKSLNKRSLKSGNAVASLEGGGKHNKAVSGLMIDALNQKVISCGLDGKVKVRPRIPSFLSVELIVSIVANIVLGFRIWTPC